MPSPLLKPKQMKTKPNLPKQTKKSQLSSLVMGLKNKKMFPYSDLMPPFLGRNTCMHIEDVHHGVI